jgi:serine/threonine-protein kinase RsbW
MNASVHNNQMPNGQKFHSSIMNCQASVSGILDEASKWLAQENVSSRKITDIQIVLAEALNNVIEHGFSCENSGNVDVCINICKDIIVVDISDNGIKFTPPEATQTPLQDTSDIEQLPEGGFGWFLIREITTSFTFHRIANKNRLVLNFH